MKTSEKIRVGVVFGGRSGEHEVSLVSAQSIIKALDREKYDVIPIGIAKTGTWLVGIEPQQMLPGPSAATPPAEGAHEGGGRPVEVCTGLVGDPTHKGMILLNQRDDEKNRIRLDVLFPVVHGTYGEDGTLQGLMELADIPYVGCGVMASALGMDKTCAKRLFRDAGLPITPFVEVRRNDWRKDPDEIISHLEATFSYPCFIKPVNSGSSVGVSKAHDRDELIAAIELAAKIDRKILIETAIDAREIEVSVLGNDDPIASMPGEIIPCNEFYDYQAKYIDDRSELRIPADLSAEAQEQVRNLAVQAYKTLDCAGLARVDFFLDRKTGAFYLNEINTIPGFTKISMYPKLWEATGISYPELVDRLIGLAFERFSEKQESLKFVV